MRNSIVEGEPGIFPDPIARAFQALNRWIRRRTGEEQPPPSPASPASAAAPDESSSDAPAGSAGTGGTRPHPDGEGSAG